MDFSRVAHPSDSNEITRAYFDGILVETRYLDSCVPDLTMELFGETFTSPIMIAAFSHLSKTHPGGMAEMARGAAQAGICNWAGMGENDELGRILSTGAKTIKIVKPYADRDKVFEHLKEAERLGVLAVGMDIDHSFGADGKPDVVLGEEMKPVSSAELRQFVRATSKPFIVKGVLSVSDAEKCVEAGAKGLLISHHHGIMPCAVPPLMALPSIRNAVMGSGAELFVDCSVDSGYDAFKCLALGAKAVCVGRAVLDSFAKQGSNGVAAYIAQMNRQLASMMARTGSKNLAGIARDVLWDAVKSERL